MNTATVSLLLVVGGPNVADAWVPGGPSLEKTLGTDSQTVEAPTSFVDLGQVRQRDRRNTSGHCSMSTECTTT